MANTRANVEALVSQHQAPTVVSRQDRRVAYVMLYFPKLSETFVAREISALTNQQWNVQIYPLRLEQPDKIHDDVKLLLNLVRWCHPLTLAVLGANIRMLARRPMTYLDTIRMIAADGIRQPVRMLKSVALLPTMVWIAADLQARRINHVHAHFASFPALAALVVHRFTGISYSFTAHAFDLYVAPSLLEEKVSNARFVVTISEYNRRLLQRVLSHSTRPLHVVHCGVSIPASLPPAAQGRPHILCVGRLEEKKGQSYLVDACKHLHHQGVNFQCTIIGAGRLMPRLAQQIHDSGLSHVVRLAGARTSEEVQQALRQATIFVLPSVVLPDGNMEGISVALMEAMAQGVPVITTNISGNSELIEHETSGLLVPPGDSHALAAAITKVLHDAPLRDRFRVAAYEHVRTEFNIDVTAGQMTMLLAEAVAAT